ncbi:hypothetical protein RRSWK_03650 [Rhodopirellula sp. SWK7]|nr:hypothetical protein RRSWK_03650 [Rhodopirellula sp. SWK7]
MCDKHGVSRCREGSANYARQTNAAVVGQRRGPWSLKRKAAGEHGEEWAVGWHGRLESHSV